jgi:hypothetical protein
MPSETLRVINAGKSLTNHATWSCRVSWVVTEGAMVLLRGAPPVCASGPGAARRAMGWRRSCRR